MESRLKASNYPMKKGWSVKIRTGGGGGYGDPFERDVEKVARDCNYGYISPEHARERYGVIFDEEGKVDLLATRKVREEER